MLRKSTIQVRGRMRTDYRLDQERHWRACSRASKGPLEPPRNFEKGCLRFASPVLKLRFTVTERSRDWTEAWIASPGGNFLPCFSTCRRLLFQKMPGS